MYVSGWWCNNHLEKWWTSTVGMMTFPTEWKVIKTMFQTTNHIYIYTHGLMMFNDDLTCFTFIWSNFELRKPCFRYPKWRNHHVCWWNQQIFIHLPKSCAHAGQICFRFSIHLWAFFTPSHLYPFLLVSLFDGWETLSSSLAPHWIGNI